MSRPDELFHSRLAARHRLGLAFQIVCLLSTLVGLLFVGVLLVAIFWQAWGWIDWQFLTSFDSRIPSRSGVLAGLVGSLWLLVLTALLSVPVGVGAAIYLEEYAKPTRLTRLIQLNLSNLAGVPSIVYGILGLTVFVRMFGAQQRAFELLLGFTTLQVHLPLGRAVISGALTLSLLVLPTIIIAAQEALRSVPPSLRHASYALGATRWQTVRHQVLPAALPGILTGIILSLSRAIGEAAPLIVIGAVTYVAFLPGRINSVHDLAERPHAMLEAPFDYFTAIPIQVYNWASQPRDEYQHVAAAGIVVLLALLLLFNGTAVFLRHRVQRKIRW